jgi:ring-1,2-phenylacetyl-CoA epoxidase subunit PaaC
MLDPYLREALVGKLTALADDEVVLAQRLSEWVAHAPILEEDIAIANLAQDELGHAKLYLELRQELDGSDPRPGGLLEGPPGLRERRLGGASPGRLGLHHGAAVPL